MTAHDGIRVEGTLDGQLDLLDRQIVSNDGHMIAKVDDIELEERANGTLIVSGLLIGPGALGPRLSGALGYVTVNTWARLSGRNPHEPRRIDYSHVTGISTVVTLDEDRHAVDIDGLETWTRTRVIDALPGAGNDHDPDANPNRSRLGSGPAQRGNRHRLSDLTGMTVRFADGRDGDQVTDVRLTREGSRGHLQKLVTDGIIVGCNRPGTLFGYDRDRQHGPWMVQRLLRLVHRHTGYAQWSDIDVIDWESRVLHLTTDLRPLPKP